MSNKLNQADIDNTSSRFAVKNTIAKVVIQFAGDSGDGMQVIGRQFTQASAALGNDVHTFVDYPSEIRAPAGSPEGVSGFQLCFSEILVHTAGDKYDVLVAMNPSALKVSLPNVVKGGMILVDADKFTTKDLKKADFNDNPLLNDTLVDYRIIPLPITNLTLKAIGSLSLTRAKARKCKNMFALGVVSWLFNRPLQSSEEWIKVSFAKDEEVVQANLLALQAGYNYAITAELLDAQCDIKPAQLALGRYRHVTGNQALALGVVASAYLSKKKMMVFGYPITPASDIMHYLAPFSNFNIHVMQLEDEIACACAAIGAAYGGALALTVTSGPGMDLKTEAIGLAVMAELPLVIVDVQRAGPSTGMPTKVSQTDLLAAVYGRHGECPVPVLAPSTPNDCFDTIMEAFQIAVKAMTPVIVLSDAYLANSAEPWQIPKIEDLKDLNYPKHPNTDHFIQRDPTTLTRPWIIPGTPGMMHRMGGLEKKESTGSISSDPDNHQKMVDLRLAKINRIREDYRPLEILGEPSGDLLLIGWGGTHGTIQTVVEQLSETYKISAWHTRYLFPLPKDLGNILQKFKKIAVVELNKGQLCTILRAEYLLDIKSISKVSGQPFKVEELCDRVLSLLGSVA